MPRRPQVRYWQTRGTWYDEEGKSHKGGYFTTRNGKQIELATGPEDLPNGPTYQKAMKAFRDLLDLEFAPSAKDTNTPRVVFECWMREHSGKLAEMTVRNRKLDMQLFCSTEWADRPVYHLTPYVVSEFVRTMRMPRQVKQKTPNGKVFTRTYAWGPAQETRFLTSLKAAFSWAAKSGLITKSPLAGMDLPPARSRSRECVVSRDDHRRILETAKGQLREFIVCLEATGARPNELLQVTARDWQEKLGGFELHAATRRKPGESGHKTARKGKTRHIIFTGESLAIMRARVAKYPAGPLWRAAPDYSRPWYIRRVQAGFEAIATKLGLEHFTPYSYRHTLATEWLEGGGSIDDLAAFLGNSVTTIRRHYSHLTENVDRLRSLAEQFNAGRNGTPPRILPLTGTNG